MYDAGKSYYKLGKYDHTERMYRRALDLREKGLGRESRSTLEIKDSLAVVLYKQGDYGKAGKMHLQVLEQIDKIQGRKVHFTLANLNNSI
jgi:tetratricopeptide (TPR) repeat protein